MAESTASTGTGPVVSAEDTVPAVDIDAERARLLSDVIAAAVDDSELEAGFRLGPEERVIRVASGDTLLGLLVAQSVPEVDAHAVVDTLEDVFDPRRLQIGQEIVLEFQHTGFDNQFSGLELMPDVESVVSVRRDGETDAFAVGETPNQLETRRIAAAGEIDSSLAAAADQADIPYEVLVQAIRAYSFHVDFQRDIQPGDSFEILFDMDYHADGEFARGGAMQYAKLNLSGRDMPIYRFESSDGFVDYYDPDGVSIRRALLRTPIDGARLSSSFGMRRHPILGYTRMHRGTDFAAPPGTPIFAAGDGVIETRERHRGYGRFIRIRHNRRMMTAYAHMSRFADGLGIGSRVEQGDVIGYVGSSGLSTGPHLHYEVLVDGSQVNPMSVDLPTGRTLDGDDLRTFRAMIDTFDTQFTAVVRRRQVAERPTPR